MTRYAAFLRGVNLGRSRRVGSAELREAFEGAGLEHVSAFRTSGNVAFDGGRAAVAKLQSRIERALTDATGFDVAVFLRSERDLRAIAAFQPFPPRAPEESKGKLQVLLLAARPRPAAKREVESLTSDADKLAFAGRELYWLPRGGTQESALDLKAIEKRVGPTTMRTKGTIEQLAAKFFAG